MLRLQCQDFKQCDFVVLTFYVFTFSEVFNVLDWIWIGLNNVHTGPSCGIWDET